MGFQKNDIRSRINCTINCNGTILILILFNYIIFNIFHFNNFKFQNFKKTQTDNQTTKFSDIYICSVCRNTFTEARIQTFKKM